MRHIFDLTSDWEMRPVSDPEWLPAIVPGSVYVDLMNNGKMPDPYYRDQEAIAYDLMETDYVYRKTFIPDAALLGALELRLVMEGIDTLADISINNQFVLHTENMHRTYMIDIRSFVHEGENTLTILLRSPLRAAHAAYERHQVPGSSDSVQGFAMIRKAHCMYGWDWGPRLPDAGIYRPIYLWAVSLCLAITMSVRALVHAHASGAVIGLIALSSALSCLVNFAFGKHFGHGAVSVTQSLGQKNTVFAIWMGYSFFSPVSSATGGLYSIWQNLFNSWQLEQKRKKEMNM